MFQTPQPCFPTCDEHSPASICLFILLLQKHCGSSASPGGGSQAQGTADHRTLRGEGPPPLSLPPHLPHLPPSHPILPPQDQLHHWARHYQTPAPTHYQTPRSDYKTNMLAYPSLKRIPEIIIFTMHVFKGPLGPFFLRARGGLSWWMFYVGGEEVFNFTVFHRVLLNPAHFYSSLGCRNCLASSHTFHVRTAFILTARIINTRVEDADPLDMRYNVCFFTG